MFFLTCHLYQLRQRGRGLTVAMPDRFILQRWSWKPEVLNQTDGLSSPLFCKLWLDHTCF